jgi:hypothetical protein
MSAADKINALKSIPISNKPAKKTVRGPKEDSATVIQIKQILELYNKNKALIHKKLESNKDQAVPAAVKLLFEEFTKVAAELTTDTEPISVDPKLINYLSDVGELYETADRQGLPPAGRTDTASGDGKKSTKVGVKRDEPLIGNDVTKLFCLGYTTMETLSKLWSLKLMEHPVLTTTNTANGSKIPMIKADKIMLKEFAEDFATMTKLDSEKKSKEPKPVFNPACFSIARFQTINRLNSTTEALDEQEKKIKILDAFSEEELERLQVESSRISDCLEARRRLIKASK